MVRRLHLRWRRAGLAETGRLGPGPSWCWLTRTGLDACGLGYDAKQPALGRLRHIHATGRVRVRHGRWWLLTARVMVAAAVPVAGWLSAPGYPAAWAALAIGSATWLVRTGRYDLAPGPPG